MDFVTPPRPSVMSHSKSSWTSISITSSITRGRSPSRMPSFLSSGPWTGTRYVVFSNLEKMFGSRKRLRSQCTNKCPFIREQGVGRSRPVFNRLKKSCAKSSLFLGLLMYHSRLDYRCFDCSNKLSHVIVHGYMHAAISSSRRTVSRMLV